MLFACAAAMLAATLLRNGPIYDPLRERILLANLEIKAFDCHEPDLFGTLMPYPVTSTECQQHRLALKLFAGALLLLGVAWLGRYFGHHLPALERWVASHGALGFVVFIVAVVVCTSLFVPDTVFAVLAGVLFGVFQGTLVIVFASLLTTVVDFAISRQFLSEKVQRWLDANPRLAAIVHAVKREGLRFLFLLRLTPIHPVTVSYVLGATNTRFPTFLAASLGLIPGLFVEVYFGYVAKHVAKVSGKVSEHSTLHTVLTIAGLVLSIALLVYVTRLSRRALSRYEDVVPAAA
jgi:uncharacterized membrane protein YdjX (TVP38/TMEM64 family)